MQRQQRRSQQHDPELITAQPGRHQQGQTPQHVPGLHDRPEEHCGHERQARRPRGRSALRLEDEPGDERQRDELSDHPHSCHRGVNVEQARPAADLATTMPTAVGGDQVRTLPGVASASSQPRPVRVMRLSPANTAMTIRAHQTHLTTWDQNPARWPAQMMPMKGSTSSPMGLTAPAIPISTAAAVGLRSSASTKATVMSPTISASLCTPTMKYA